VQDHGDEVAPGAVLAAQLDGERVVGNRFHPLQQAFGLIVFGDEVRQYGRLAGFVGLAGLLRMLGRVLALRVPTGIALGTNRRRRDVPWRLCNRGSILYL
jgi:hypothetical protein